MRRPPRTILTEAQRRAVATVSISHIHDNLVDLMERPTLDACPPEVRRYLRDAATALERAGAAASPSKTVGQDAAQAAAALAAHLFGTRRDLGMVATGKDAAGRDKIIVHIPGAWTGAMPAVWAGFEVEWFTAFDKIRPNAG